MENSINKHLKSGWSPADAGCMANLTILISFVWLIKGKTYFMLKKLHLKNNIM